MTGKWISLIIAFICLVFFVSNAALASSIIENSLNGALPLESDLSSGINWETDGPLYESSETYGRSEIMYRGYDGNNNVVSYIQGFINFYPETVSANQEFMRDPDANLESNKKFWGSHGSLEEIQDLPGGLLLISDENTQWWSSCKAFFWRAPGLYGDIKVEGNGNLEKLGIDRRSYTRGETIRLAHLIWERLPGGKTESKEPFTCPVGGEAPLRIDPNIPGHGLCRGACGSDCPSSCVKLPDIILYFLTGENEYYSCTYENVISCGSHSGCRDHDECYDRCVAEEGETNLFGNCHLTCNTNCTDEYGYFTCYNWTVGWPPFDSNLTYSDSPVQAGPFTSPVQDFIEEDKT
ncbi:MAG: hypothetical protein JXA44_12980 [Methanospirillaceae archaeon]|nr:hypothetical protein [Methanospirillaceae archaeon]